VENQFIFGNVKAYKNGANFWTTLYMHRHELIEGEARSMYPICLLGGRKGQMRDCSAFGVKPKTYTTPKLE